MTKREKNLVTTGVIAGVTLGVAYSIFSTKTAPKFNMWWLVAVGAGFTIYSYSKIEQ